MTDARGAEARPRGTRVGLFVTCLVDLLRPSIGFAAVKLLEDAGCTVAVADSSFTTMPRSRDRSISMPSERRGAPHQLWPPERTAMRSPRDRARATAVCTSCRDSGRTIISGKRSGTQPLHTVPARSGS